MQIPPCGGLTERVARTVSTGAILARVPQDAFRFILAESDLSLLRRRVVGRERPASRFDIVEHHEPADVADRDPVLDLVPLVAVRRISADGAADEERIEADLNDPDVLIHPAASLG